MVAAVRQRPELALLVVVAFRRPRLESAGSASGAVATGIGFAGSIGGGAAWTGIGWTGANFGSIAGGAGILHTYDLSASDISSSRLSYRLEPLAMISGEAELIKKSRRRS